jgi:hypothetical protein
VVSEFVPQPVEIAVNSISPDISRKWYGIETELRKERIKSEIMKTLSNKEDHVGTEIENQGE